ncbi:MAG: hypothetical protein ACRYG8_33095, partial [Janthinobacterium lividum]
MPTRRGLLGAGLAFCSCCLLDRARAQQPTPARRPVIVGGQRVKTIDTHCHCIFQDALSLMGGAGQAVVPPTRGVDEHFLLKGVERRLRSMDEMGIDMEILSINPFWYGADRETAGRV